jgi:hypothetical protein
LPNGGANVLVLSGDRYFTAEIDTKGGDAADPAIGRLTVWHESGFLKDLWPEAPPTLDGFQPWDDKGVTATFLGKGGGPQIIVSRARRWIRDGNDWPPEGAGFISEDWRLNDAGPQELEGGVPVPWVGDYGVTAAYFTPGGATFYAISQDKAWVRLTSAAASSNWTWVNDGGGAFFLRDSKDWSSAPPINGQRPWDGAGVTAAFYVYNKFFVISVDRMWTTDGKTWVAAGMLKDIPGWSSASPSACPR